VEEIRTQAGTKFVARWQYYVADPEAPGGRRRESGYHEIGSKVYHGPKDALTSTSAAEKKWAQIRDSVMGRTHILPAVLKAEKTLHWWAEEDPDGFRKRREERWNGSTPEWYGYITKKIFAHNPHPDDKHSVTFGETKLKELKEQDLQKFLNELADDDYSESVVKNARLYIRAILDEAQEAGIIAVNPAARLVKPRNTRKPQRRWLSVEHYQTILDNAPTLRDRLMLKILYVGSLRRGELFGLQWRDFDGTATLFIVRQILDNLTVGPAKTDGSTAPVAISQDIVEELNEWHKWCPNPAPDGWIFSSARNAIHGQYIKPLLGDKPAYIREQLKSISDLRPIDSTILARACSIAVEQGHVDLIEANRLVADLKKEGIGEAQIMETQELLEAHYFIEPQPVLGPPSAYDFAITTSGFEAFAQVGIRDYPAIVAKVSRYLVLNVSRTQGQYSNGIAQEVGQSVFIVEHILKALALRGLIEFEGKHEGDLYVYNVSPELRRTLEGSDEK
jgi:integrase